MDRTFAHAVTKISELPLGTQRIIGEALLDGAALPDLPVIEFTAEEEAMIDEGLTDLEAGLTFSQEEMEDHFRELRSKTYAAI